MAVWKQFHVYIVMSVSVLRTDRIWGLGGFPSSFLAVFIFPLILGIICNCQQFNPANHTVPLQHFIDAREDCFWTLCGKRRNCWYPVFSLFSRLESHLFFSSAFFGEDLGYYNSHCCCHAAKTVTSVISVITEDFLLKLGVRVNYQKSNPYYQGRQLKCFFFFFRILPVLDFILYQAPNSRALAPSCSALVLSAIADNLNKYRTFSFSEE